MKRWVSSVTLNNTDCGFKSGTVLFVERSVVYATYTLSILCWELVREKTDLEEQEDNQPEKTEKALGRETYPTPY